MPTKATLYLCLCLTILSACTQKHYEVVNTGHEGQPIPNLDLISSDSSHHINTQDVPPGAPIILLYFRPDCPFCRSEITGILENLSTFREARFYLIAANASNLLKIFTKNIQRRHISNFFITLDYNNGFQDYFSPQAVPYTAIYRRDRTLSKTYLGTLSSKELTKALND
jgi:hypothetical protein